MPVHFTSGFSLSPVHCFFTNFHRHVSANSFGDSLARVEINWEHVEYQLGLGWGHCRCMLLYSPYFRINTFHAGAIQQLICPKSVGVLTEFPLKHFLLMMQWQQATLTNGRILASQTAERFLAFKTIWNWNHFNRFDDMLRCSCYPGSGSFLAKIFPLWGWPGYEDHGSSVSSLCWAFVDSNTLLWSKACLKSSKSSESDGFILDSWGT